MDRPFFKPAEPWNGGTVNGTLEFDFNITKLKNFKIYSIKGKTH